MNSAAKLRTDASDDTSSCICADRLHTRLRDDVAHGGLSSHGVAAGEHSLGAHPRELGGGRLTHPSVGTRDHRDLACEVGP